MDDLAVESAVLASYEMAGEVSLAWDWSRGLFAPISLSLSPALGLTLCPLNPAILLADAVT